MGVDAVQLRTCQAVVGCGACTTGLFTACVLIAYEIGDACVMLDADSELPFEVAGQQGPAVDGNVVSYTNTMYKSCESPFVSVRRFSFLASRERAPIESVGFWPLRLGALRGDGHTSTRRAQQTTQTVRCRVDGSCQ